jgi:G3E family GTPase
MASLNLDAIIVEASGLAKPSPLLEIISNIQQRTNHEISYSGMICVIDAERYHLLSQSLKTIEEQVVFSDWFIVNKIDLVDEATVEGVKASIKGLRPLAPIFTTTFGVVDQAMIELLESSQGGVELKQINGEAYSGWGVHGRPKKPVKR